MSESKPYENVCDDCIKGKCDVCVKLECECNWLMKHDVSAYPRCLECNIICNSPYCSRECALKGVTKCMQVMTGNTKKE